MPYSPTASAAAARDMTGGSTTSGRTNDSIDSSSDRKSSTNLDTLPVIATGDGPTIVSSSAGASDSSNRYGGTITNNNGGAVGSSGEQLTPIEGLRRHSSVSIQLPRNPLLPQGKEKSIDKGRLRNASPKPNSLAVTIHTAAGRCDEMQQINLVATCTIDGTQHMTTI
ncbi:hypothetical protein GMORB2_3165 [Geosmithia morbida]|uniref:Uncharacterized protein n=1 Tax=Geosmithia morbida TaxID=1094350 RepID=A0A9P5D3C2_9HYPO|nr:uncharacterized protein GMORB2_3165 [Geosmithia morbida]KAF4120364.1 hypothetical protein GMORB2_3165 [Geosmithia morbida]